MATSMATVALATLRVPGLALVAQHVLRGPDSLHAAVHTEAARDPPLGLFAASRDDVPSEMKILCNSA